MFNPNDYIKTENIEKFRNFMVSNKTIATALYGDYSDNLGFHKLIGNRRILTVPSNKFDIENGFVSIVQYLAPSTLVTGLNTCRFAGDCAKVCLAFQGRLQLHVRESYTKKTIALFQYTELYLRKLLTDFYILSIQYALENKQVFLRLNGLSDLPFHTVIDYQKLVNDIPNMVAGYDYTKKPINDSFNGYHVTYSWNEKSTLDHASRFGSVAYVLNKKDVKRLLQTYPDTFVDGDHSDIRPLDNRKHVLLSFKGKKTKNDFVMSYDGLVSLLGLEGVTC